MRNGGMIVVRGILLLLASCTVQWLGPQWSHADSKTSRPNILLIYTDDHRATGVGAFGGSQVATPNLDQLASEGFTLQNAYLMGSFHGATCIPSRAMLLTGRNLFQLGGRGSRIPVEHQTIGEVLHQAGYNTHIVGKWHQDHASLARSFDSGATLMGLGVYLVDHFRMPLWDWNPAGKYPRNTAYLLATNQDGEWLRRPIKGSETRGPTGTERDGPHTSEIFADSAANYIRGYDDSSPFFMYLAFHAPHDPRQAPERFRSLYSPSDIELPPSVMPQHPFDNGHMVLRDEQLAEWPRTPAIVRQQLADYYSIITHLDAQIGKVIDALKQSGKYDNTLIVMAGDSGLAVGCHGLLGKQNIYDEDGLHIPLIFSGGALDGLVGSSDALCYTHDVAPTICEMAAVDAPESFTGKSLAPVIHGQTATIRNHTFHAYRQFQRAIRKDGYKLIEYVRAPDSDRKRGEIVSGSRVTQLFHIAADPWETTDLAFLPDQAQRVEVLRNELRIQAELLGDMPSRVDQTVDFWDYYEPK